MTNEELKLARRAAACTGWMPGMLAVESAVPGMALTTRPVRVDDTWPDVGVWLPDITDAATIGCMLAMYEATRRSLTCPDPVYTTAAVLGLAHPITIERIIEALEAS